MRSEDEQRVVAQTSRVVGLDDVKQACDNALFCDVVMRTIKNMTTVDVIPGGGAGGRLGHSDEKYGRGTALWKGSRLLEPELVTCTAQVCKLVTCTAQGKLSDFPRNAPKRRRRGEMVPFDQERWGA